MTTSIAFWVVYIVWVLYSLAGYTRTGEPGRWWGFGGSPFELVEVGILGYTVFQVILKGH